jgi:hypothetical protein
MSCTLVAALAGPKLGWWWTELLVGVAELVLGVWAVGSWQRSLLSLVTLVGCGRSARGWASSSPRSLCVALQVVESVSYETVRQALQQTGSSRG